MIHIEAMFLWYVQLGYTNTVYFNGLVEGKIYRLKAHIEWDNLWFPRFRLRFSLKPIHWIQLGRSEEIMEEIHY